MKMSINSQMTRNLSIQTQLSVYMPRLQIWLKRQAEGGFDRIERRLYLFLLPVCAAYLMSVFVGGVVGHYLVSEIVASHAKLVSKTADTIQQASDRPVLENGRDLQKVIKERNIFSSDGKFPDEKFGGEMQAGHKSFDINAPCVPSTLPLELLGTIYLGDMYKSFATVKDKSYSEADIYKVGDTIYGNDQASVAAVERQKIVINNNGAKECIDLEKPATNAASDGFPSGPSGEFGGLPSSSAGSGSEITLESSYVEGELGPGFGKIVDAARLVPNTVDGGINGFKIFAIKGGTLFARIGLQNGDIITQVNDTSMKQPEQGFALYQTFQDDKEVRIQYLRGGTVPQNITVRIK